MKRILEVKQNESGEITLAIKERKKNDMQYLYLVLAISTGVIAASVAGQVFNL